MISPAGKKVDIQIENGFVGMVDRSQLMSGYVTALFNMAQSGAMAFLRS